MHPKSLVLIGFIAASTISSGGQEPEKNSFQVDFVSPGGNHFIVDTPAPIAVKITNISGKAQPVPSGIGGRWYLNGQDCSGEHYWPLLLSGMNRGSKPSSPEIAPAGKSWIIMYDMRGVCGSKQAGNYEFEYRFGIENALAAPKKIRLVMEEPSPADKLAHEELAACGLEIQTHGPSAGADCNEWVLLDKHPTSIYAGWALFNYQDAADPLTPSCKKAIAAALNQNAEGLKRYWKLDSPAMRGRVSTDRKIIYQNYSAWVEKFLSTHPDFPVGGWLATKAGAGNLALGQFAKACFFFKQAREMSWKSPDSPHPESDSQPYQSGNDLALKMLSEGGYCR